MELYGLKWTDIYDLEDTSLIASRITENLCTPLNRMAPIKLRNLKSIKNRGVKLSSDIKKLMVERDSLKLKA